MDLLFLKPRTTLSRFTTCGVPFTLSFSTIPWDWPVYTRTTTLGSPETLCRLLVTLSDSSKVKKGKDKTYNWDLTHRTSKRYGAVYRSPDPVRTDLRHDWLLVGGNCQRVLVYEHKYLRHVSLCDHPFRRLPRCDDSTSPKVHSPFLE